MLKVWAFPFLAPSCCVKAQNHHFYLLNSWSIVTPHNPKTLSFHNFLIEGIQAVFDKRLSNTNIIDSCQCQIYKKLVIVGGPLALPNMWLKKLLNIPTSPENEPYFSKYFSIKMNIHNCLIKAPRKANYMGHPFYYSALKTYKNISEECCQKFENLI